MPGVASNLNPDQILNFAASDLGSSGSLVTNLCPFRGHYIGVKWVSITNLETNMLFKTFLPLKCQSVMQQTTFILF